MVVVILAFAYLADLVGLPDFGASDWILDFYENIISFSFELPISGYEGIDQAMLNSGLGFDLPDIPENKHFRSPSKATEGGGGAFSTGNGTIDGLLNGTLGYAGNLMGGGGGGGGGGTGNTGVDLIGTIGGGLSGGSLGSIGLLSAMSYSEGLYALHDALPLFAGMVNFVSMPFFMNKKSEEIIVAFIDNLKGKTKRKTPRIRQVGERTTKIDPVMMSIIVFILIAAWFILLAYSNSYGENAREDWKYIIYIYYALVTAVSGILLMFVFRNYSVVTIWSFIKGTVYGLIGLFFISRLFMSRVTFNAMSSIDMHNNYSYALNTFVFIAPAETIVFCVFLPCFFLWLITRGETKAFKADSQYTKQQKLDRLEILIQIQHSRVESTQKDIDFYSFLEGKLVKVTKDHGTKTGLEQIHTKKKVAKFTDRLKRRNKTLSQLKTLKTKVSQETTDTMPTFERDKILVENPKKLFAYVIGMFIASIAFASLHWATISGEISFSQFWVSGLAIAFFCGGLYMAIISWRYDYAGASLAHTIFNCSSILMVCLAAGI